MTRNRWRQNGRIASKFKNLNAKVNQNADRQTDRWTDRHTSSIHKPELLCNPAENCFTVWLINESSACAVYWATQRSYSPVRESWSLCASALMTLLLSDRSRSSRPGVKPVLTLPGSRMLLTGLLLLFDLLPVTNGSLVWGTSMNKDQRRQKLRLPLTKFKM